MILRTSEKVLEADPESNSSLTHSLGPLEMISGLFSSAMQGQPCLSAKNTRMGVGVEFFVISVLCVLTLFALAFISSFLRVPRRLQQWSWILSASVARRFARY
jgi:uncharacterized protein HemY